MKYYRELDRERERVCFCLSVCLSDSGGAVFSMLTSTVDGGDAAAMASANLQRARVRLSRARSLARTAHHSRAKGGIAQGAVWTAFPPPACLFHAARGAASERELGKVYVTLHTALSFSPSLYRLLACVYIS